MLCCVFASILASLLAPHESEPRIVGSWQWLVVGPGGGTYIIYTIFIVRKFILYRTVMQFL